MVWVSQQMGLSPQVRGNLGSAARRARHTGPIPAGAGEPSINLTPMLLSRAYPRRCGGTTATPTIAVAIAGLSPQVRGNLSRQPARRRAHGPIPAGAGEPAHTPAPRRRSRAYPRRCGGTYSRLACSPLGPGLSPQVRGNPISVLIQSRFAGPIPAGAGEPPTPETEMGADGAYPRRCGGTLARADAPFPRPGLSPQVRGNR